MVRRHGGSRKILPYSSLSRQAALRPTYLRSQSLCMNGFVEFHPTYIFRNTLTYWTRRGGFCSPLWRSGGKG